MAVLPIVTSPDPRLNICSEQITTIDNDVKQLAKDMIETMYHEDGIGLAAVQIGVHKRMIVMDLEYHETHEKNPCVFINPVIVTRSSEYVSINEGCISFPDIRAEINRHEKVTVEYMDLNGHKKSVEASNLFSICLQHEIDHINGITFITHLSPLKRQMILKKMRKKAPHQNKKSLRYDE